MIGRYSNPAMARIWSEENKVTAWLKVEIAVCEAWAQRGIIPEEAMEIIRQATVDLKRMAEIEKETDHDLIAFVRAAGESLPDRSAARFIHLGLTSNDVVDTGLALQAVEAADLLLQDILAAEKAVTARALEHRHTPTVGRSHGMHAEPTTFGFKLAGWVDELRRDRTRLEDARQIIAVGKIAGAVGTHANVPPDVEDEVLSALGLRPEPVATQVVQRDRHAQFMTTLAIVGASLERFATEMRHLQRSEVREAEEPFGEGQQGSSAMPHKRNPHRSERLSGLARLLRGYAVTSLENVALWHERDISHSSTERVIFPDACLTLDYMLGEFTALVEGWQIYPEQMRANLQSGGGLVFSQQVLLALVEKGMDRQQAYKTVQRNAMKAWKEHDDFKALLKADSVIRDRLTEAEIEKLFDEQYHLKYIDTAFARLGLLPEEGS